MLAGMQASVDAARRPTGGRPGWLCPGPAVPAGRGIDVQLVAGETAVRVTEQAIQILGGDG